MKSNLKNTLLKHQPTFSKVVEFDDTTDRLYPVDFTAANKELTDELITDTKKFSEYITNKLQSNNCKYGIGGYNELREMYKRSALFSFAKDSNSIKEKLLQTTAEPRRLHLGIDIWGNAGTKVFAPLGGMVHSFANNNNFGDYGATIILQHQLDTVVFYTLYGHLSLKDLSDLKVGRFFTRGQCIAHFGSSLENGNWPPHLHFQIIEDMEQKEGDYPGVCKVSEKEKYLSNCPDADLILNLMQYVKK
jgi:peptidoglycan LD-endopeptidase LytH